MSERAADLPAPAVESTLDAKAPGLARAHQPLNRARPRAGELVDFRALQRSIERATREFRTPRPDDPVYQKAAEWLLDNHFLVARTVRQVGSELPKGFRRRLPHVGADDLPRVLRISHALVEATSLDFDETALLGFVAAYQKQAPLGIAELWALPTMLRISVLEALAQMLDVFFPPTHARPRWWDLLVDPAVGVARAIRALRLLAEIDWKAFFQTTSAVDATLRADPAGVYALMDFETRDTYRKVVEELAWVAERPEPDVAALAVSLASERSDNPRESHVGYYLIGPGRSILEQRIGYRQQGMEPLRSSLLAHPTLAYLGLISGASLFMVAAVAALGARVLGTGAIVALCVLSIVPLSSIAVAFTNWCMTALLPPRTLPKLDFSEKIPDAFKTAIVIPALVAKASDVDDLLAQLELHYLANPDPALVFVLLIDHVDSDELPDDEALLAHAEEILGALNLKHGDGSRAPFHLLYRESAFNPAEKRFMGWERKRGKLEEFNRLLAGDAATSFKRQLGDTADLRGVRFVITLDADTELPLGAAKRLIGLLAHPLNRAVFDAQTGRVVSGYTVVQPRIEASPVARAESWFSRTFAGDTALDIYTHAVSDVYQDLFGSGIYVGKGIYDVEAFARSVAGRVPENALASHDLFEGIHGRVGLATDVVLFEKYPHHYLVFARRMHRWIRGDWQLLPWLLRRRSARPGSSTFRLRLVDRWKIADNLRRSLLAPSLLALLVFGWLAFPERALLWTALPLFVPLALFVPALLGDQRKEAIARWAFGVALLAYEAWLAIDAIVRVLVRLTITRRHLLEWITAAHAERALSERASRWLFFREMRPALLTAGAIAAGLLLVRPAALPFAAPLCLLFVVSPELARRASGVPVVPRHLEADDRRKLRRLARRTWLFFETFVGPGDQWLPPDNFQEEPGRRIAHRTSPTNIGLFLVSELSAWDLGYVGASELSARLLQSLDSLGRLERYKGHLLNWYNTKTREALLPRYVSTVDSGNLAAALITLAKGCQQASDAPLLPPCRFEGLVDTLDLLEEALSELPPEQAPVGALSAIRSLIERAGRDAAEWRGAVLALSDSELPMLERALLDVLERTTDHHDISPLREARTWLDRLNHQLYGVRVDIETLLPWLALKEEARALGFDVHVDLETPAGITLSDVGGIVEKACLALRSLRPELANPEHAAWLEKAETRLRAGETRASALRDELRQLAARADAAWAAMDFTFLYDGKRKLFHIGYNATSDRLDPHYYDLLASEARLASYIAVIRKQAPPTHWYALGRAVTKVRGSVALLSWGGTMFEYLMPGIFMRSPDRTLLAQSAELAVLAQIDHGKQLGTPWGISESGYAELDAQHDYQYRSFGIPALGLKRGLEEDLVIAPYACVLALPLCPRAALGNLEQLEALGALGTHGLFEALDFRESRADEAPRKTGRAHRPFSVVRSHMAHHQGMILATLDNVLNEDILVERFHADPLVRAGEPLLSERLPSARVAETLDVPKKETVEPPSTTLATFPAWSPDATTSGSEVALLTNGRLTTLVTDTGAGFTRFGQVAVTRGSGDPTCDLDGSFIYVEDQSSGRSWSATPAPTRARRSTDHVSFHPHKVEFHHREQGISLRTEIGVGPLDDVEIRYLTLHNETDEPRKLTLVSALEPVLESAAAAPRHPAFSRLFVQCEILGEQHAIVASRRTRSPDELGAVAVHFAVWESPAVKWVGFQTDRSAFIGRRRDARAPRKLVEAPGPNAPRSKAVLDPVMALAVEVSLAPSATAQVAFLTALGKTREAALDLARSYASLHAVRWAVHDAERESGRRLEAAGVAPALLPEMMHLVSRLLFAGPEYRVPRASQLPAGTSQRDLWRHGISGDDPLIVVRVRDPDASPLVGEVLATYRYLRTCKMRVELVFLDESATGYQAEATGSVRRFVMRAGAGSWLHQRGGIFVLATDQLSAGDRLRVEAAARVFFDAERGSLRDQRLGLPALPPPLPHFPATLAPDENVPRALSVPKLIFANGYGGFTEDGREYVVVSKDGTATPAPWCNVLANAEFGCLVSESSLGASWSLNSGENRLTPWRNDPVSDAPSEALFLRDEETAEVWTPTPLPAGLGADVLVRHGAGYTVYERASHGLDQELTVFVPPDAPVKILRLKLENRLARPRRLTATYYAEWVLGAFREEAGTRVMCELDAAAQCLFARSAWNSDFAERVAFVTADRTPHGFTCDRTEFIGRSGSLAAPDALERWGLGSSTRIGADPCAALQTHVELAPGQALELFFVLGQGADRAHALELVERFRQPAEVDAAWRRLGAFWDGLLGAVRVKTPEPAMDLMLNRWLLYQSLSSRCFARSAFYQAGGAFGFRDQLQDMLAFLHVAPDRVRAHLLDAASRQFEEGDVLHWWHPPVGRGVRTRCSDDLLWLPFVAAQYVAATGDTSILSEQVSFLSATPLEPDEHDRYADFAVSPERASLLEHCRRALRRGFSEGPHGLPLMAGGDWNDGMNRVGTQGRGESVWLAWFVQATALAFAALLERLGERSEAESWRERARELRARVEDVAWDGAWYVRAFYDDGSPLGSARSRNCHIDSIAQSWAVLSGPGDSPRLEQALRSAEELLVREHDRLVLLLDPPFEGARHDPGYIKAYPPGVRENGGQYTHAATWLGWAHARLGDGAGAERIFRLLNPVLRGKTPADVERYRVEPYVLAADIYSAAGFVGRGGWTWYTGAAAWLWRLGAEAILGLYREDGALRFDPCIPPHWPGFEADVRAFEHELHVVVDNPQRTGRGVLELRLDGVLLESPLVRFDRSKPARHELRIVLGQPHTVPIRAGAEQPAKIASSSR